MVSDHPGTPDVVVPQRPCGVEAVDMAQALRPAEQANWIVLAHDKGYSITHKSCGMRWQAEPSAGSVTLITNGNSMDDRYEVIDEAVCFNCMRK